MDVHDWNLLTTILQPTLDFLDSEVIPYMKAGSGGSKSVHVHVFFKPTYYGVRYGWNQVRLLLWDWILDQAEIPPEMRGNGKRWDGTNYPYDKSCANFSDMSHGKVMRDFGGKAKGKRAKTLLLNELPENREDMYTGTVIFPAEIKLWNPIKLIEQELEFDFSPPPSCEFCPVEMEWMLYYEKIDIERIFQYPAVCRGCGKLFE